MAAFRPTKQFPKALLFGVLGGVLGLLFSISPWGHLVEERFGLSWLFHLRGPVPPPQNVIIVAIDKASSDRLGVPYDTTRWPRTVHTRLLNGLRRAGVRSVTFDLLFREPRESEDEAFAAAIRGVGGVALLEFLEKDQPGAVSHANRLLPVTLQQRAPPAPALAAAAAGSGPFTLPKVPDRVSSYWTFDQNAGGVPSLPVVTLALFATPAYRNARDLIASATDAAFPSDLAGMVINEPHEYTLRALSDLLERLPEPATGEEQDRTTLQSLRTAMHPPFSRYLNFYGPPHTLKTISYADTLQLLETEQGRRQFADKAVFVGVSSPVQWHQRDEFRTVFSDSVTGLDLSGIEILATGFSNLLAQNGIRPFSAAGSAVNMLLWGVLIGLLLGLLRPLPAIMLVVVAAVVYVYLATYVFSHQFVWAPLFVPLVVLAPAMLFAATLWRYREARADLERIRHTFGHYLPPATVDRLVHEGLHTLGDRRTVFGVCLITDAEGYTSIAENIPSDQLVDLVNDYLEVIIRPIRRHGGEVSDVKGDSVLAFWASRQDEQAIRTAACRALSDIQCAVEAWNADNAYDVRLPTRIGLHCGSMTLASVGAADHFEQRAVGDIVNTASRLEQLCKELGTRTLLSVETLRDIDGIVTRGLGRFVLKGRTRPVEVHELLGWGEETRAAWSGCLRDFAAGVEAFEEQRWHDAEAAFTAALVDHADDPVTGWYLGRIQATDRASLP